MTLTPKLLVRFLFENLEGRRGFDNFEKEDMGKEREDSLLTSMEV